uniref:ferroxidase n=1 Tax=Clastoptera arizonana TaxID=38151 RepID=A0A1B6DGM7_9HEMI
MFSQIKYLERHLKVFRKNYHNLKKNFQSVTKLESLLYVNKTDVKYVNSLKPMNNLKFCLILPNQNSILNHKFSTDISEETLQNGVVFESICEETLESLYEFFDELVESHPKLKTADVIYADGVLTINLGSTFGTYVINRQSPNRQIWLSSPISGPKRYDYIPRRDGWIYRHDNKFSLHQLLQFEIEKLVQSTVSLSRCAHCGSTSL